MAGSKKLYTGATDLRDRKVTVYRSPRLIAEFEMHRRTIAKIAVGPKLKEATREVVNTQAMPYAISISPRGKTLNYVSSWKAQRTYVVIAGMRRVGCKLLNESPHAAAVEWVSTRGFGHGRGVLRRTLAHLNSVSPVGLQQATRRAAFNPQLHPRGPGGRFVPSSSPAALKRRARAAAKLTGNNP